MGAINIRSCSQYFCQVGNLVHYLNGDLLCAVPSEQRSQCAIFCSSFFIRILWIFHANMNQSSEVNWELSPQIRLQQEIRTEGVNCCYLGTAQSFTEPVLWM